VTIRKENSHPTGSLRFQKDHGQASLNTPRRRFQFENCRSINLVIGRVGTPNRNNLCACRGIAGGNGPKRHRESGQRCPAWCRFIRAHSGLKLWGGRRWMRRVPGVAAL